MRLTITLHFVSSFVRRVIYPKIKENQCPRQNFQLEEGQKVNLHKINTQKINFLNYLLCNFGWNFVYESQVTCRLNLYKLTPPPSPPPPSPLAENFAVDIDFLWFFYF